ncbi:heart- and neural crest derivatives-expressed protein 2-like [Watersipora subatra]|uniref:heart- and neural crest derivatives-expressed protein 2-like n=1 Tax=Watersipora subatra TaxID=2589382 RepID=UPI00355B243A
MSMSMEPSSSSRVQNAALINRNPLLPNIVVCFISAASICSLYPLLCVLILRTARYPEMMNSAVSAYPCHSYYSSGGEARPLGSHGGSNSWHHPTTQPHAGLSSVFDYYQPQDYYHYHPSLTSHCMAVGSTASTPSPHAYESSRAFHNGTPDAIYGQLTSEGTYAPYINGSNKKKGVNCNSKKERRRTISINGAFANLRDCIPNVPKDTKLSKIKTLRLACGYIQHLMDGLSSDNLQPMQEFKADLSRKTPCRAEKRKCIEAEIAAAAERKSRGRSGWPQTIWAQDLKGDSSSEYLPLKQAYLAADAQKAMPPLAKMKNELTSPEHLGSEDIQDACTSGHSSLCEESSSTAGSLG